MIILIRIDNHNNPMSRMSSSSCIMIIKSMNREKEINQHRKSIRTNLSAHSILTLGRTQIIIDLSLLQEEIMMNLSEICRDIKNKKIRG